MEKQITLHLKETGMHSEKALKQAEMDGLQGVDAEQMEMKYDQLNKMKQLLFRQEHKNKRIKKIKSKLYHKLKKKEKMREEGKIKAYLEDVDPEAAAELSKKDELKMAEERLSLRHGGHKKWARDMRRFKGKMDNREIREQYHDMMREKNALKDR
jgi:U3 small nucleolar RNA-associated protein 14